MADERSFYVEDPTPIIPDWAFLSDQCLSLEISLRRAADHLGESGRLLRAGRGSAQALEELQQAIDDRVDQLTGAARALRRYRGLSPEDSNEGVRMSDLSPPPSPAPPPVAPPSLLKRIWCSNVTHVLIGALAIGLTFHSWWRTKTDGKPIDVKPADIETIGALVLALISKSTGVITATVGLVGAAWGLKKAIMGDGDDHEPPPPPPAHEP